MTSFLPFIGVTILLVFEGYLCARILLKERLNLLPLALSLPLSAFINVLLVFLYTLTTVPLSARSLLVGHLVIIAILWFLGRKMHLHAPPPLPSSPISSWTKRLLLVGSMVIVASTTVYAFSHAVLLPSFQYDSATNWTMRSKISFYDQHIAFDQTEDRGMAKPQYPFLFHTLQITANQGQAVWSDTIANSIHFLLSVSSLVALFVLIRREKGLFLATVGIALCMCVPLFALHLAQGYGDITMVLEVALSIAFLALWHIHRDKRYAILSAVFVASSVWTKTEGLFFGLAPWLVTFILLAQKKLSKETLLPLAVAVLLSLPWPLYAMLSGLRLTPHSTDTSFGWHADGFHELFPALFGRGSFGITWYALPVTMLLFGFLAFKKDERIARTALPLFVWGILSFFETIFIYTFTPNVVFLINSESFYRQMLTPAVLLILACIFVMKKHNAHSSL